jgi:predicted ester cyclase
MSFETQDVIADGDKVVVRCQFAARHVGPFAGMPITGRRLSVQHIYIWRIADGKLVEHWAARDDARAMRQLGLLSIGTTQHHHHESSKETPQWT